MDKVNLRGNISLCGPDGYHHSGKPPCKEHGEEKAVNRSGCHCPDAPGMRGFRPRDSKNGQLAKKYASAKIKHLSSKYSDLKDNLPGEMTLGVAYKLLKVESIKDLREALKELDGKYIQLAGTDPAKSSSWVKIPSCRF